MSPVENPINIVSDGTYDGTFIYGPSGELVEGVTGFFVDCGLDKDNRPYVTATLTILNPELEIVCDSVALANGSAHTGEESREITRAALESCAVIDRAMVCRPATRH